MAFVVALFAAYLTMTITHFGGTSFTVLHKDDQAAAVNVTTAEVENKLGETTAAMLESQAATDENSEDYVNPGCRFLGFLIQVYLCSHM